MKRCQTFSENFQFLVVTFSIHLNRRVFVMCSLRAACHDLFALPLGVVGRL